jgi:phospho-N-acetylmuramoyl-pentapeptide-transferase
MIYNLLYEKFDILPLFKFQTFRTGGAILTALFLSFLFGPLIINALKARQKKGQPQRKDYYTINHIEAKKNTPSMGGILILLTWIPSVLIWADLKNPYIWIAISTTIIFALIGFIDDYLKIIKFNTNGLKGIYRFSLECITAAAAIIAINRFAPETVKNTVVFPFFKDLIVFLGAYYIIFGIIVIVGSANAVNLTDGLDGLTIFPAIIVAAVFMIISYIMGRIDFSNYLLLPHIPGSGELAVFCGGLIGAGLGFLWFNAYPAKVIMGDIGSLAIGAALGTVAIITNHEIVLAIAGGLFVFETITVILQVLSFKLTGKRIFKMAPFHHHFEKIGWPEPTIVIRFWVISVILGLIALGTLKLR